jgi:hypothetical protein
VCRRAQIKGDVFDLVKEQKKSMLRKMLREANDICLKMRRSIPLFVLDIKGTDFGTV